MAYDDGAWTVNDCLHGRTEVALPRVSSGMVMRSLVTAFVGLGAVALSGCAPMQTCSTTFRGGCVEGPPPPKPLSPSTVGVASAAPAVPYGDPSTFADVDDKQCRSYGLTFGSHDYADCRIRLSAQHRGLDPNIGTTPSGSGIR
jgi:hypothetical protein